MSRPSASAVLTSSGPSAFHAVTPSSSSSSSARLSSSSSAFLPPSTLITANQDPIHALTSELADLRARLLASTARIHLLETSAETSEDVLTECQAKYDRLWEAHRKLQKNNHSLEDKLLRVVDKFEADKNMMTRDLASQTQKLVQAKLLVQQLRDQNSDLQSDLQLSITLLQNRPSCYLAQRVDTLPPDMQSRVRSYIADRQQAMMCGVGGGVGGVEAKKVRVPIMEDVSGDVGENEKVSAAILAKVLEERAKERKKENKFCIDVGTQTLGWHFPVPPPPPPSASGKSSNFEIRQQQQQQQQQQQSVKSNGKAAAGGKSGGKKASTSAERADCLEEEAEDEEDTAEVIRILRSISMDDAVSRAGMDQDRGSGRSVADDQSSSSAVVGNILLASVIRSPPSGTDSITSSRSSIDFSGFVGVPGGDWNRSEAASMRRSITCSALQTEL